MEPQEKLTTQQFISDRLHDVQRKVEAGNIQDAIDELKEVKAADSKNIYIIALEKQVSKLLDAATPADLRGEIVKSLPPMIERAINDSQRRLAEKAQEPKEAKEKEAALEKLKSQYFQRADEYVEKGDYEHALEEIRRIYIIDPNNVVAKEYEQKIEQLASLKAKGGPQEQPTPPAGEAPAKKEQPTAAESEEKGKSKLPIIAAAAVIVLGIGIWLVLSSGSTDTQESKPTQEQTVADQPATAPQPEQTQQPPTPIAATGAKETKGKEQKPAEVKPTPSPATATQPKTQAKEEEKGPPQPVSEQPKPTIQQQEPPPAQVATAPQTQPAQQPQQPTPSPTEEGAAPKPFVAIESPPQIVRREAPKYPEIAYRMRMEGKVIVEVTVDPQGKPIQAKIARSSSDVFNDAAIEAAMKSTYKAAMMSTGPVTAKVYVPFDFKLR